MQSTCHEKVPAGEGAMAGLVRCRGKVILCLHCVLNLNVFYDVHQYVNKAIGTFKRNNLFSSFSPNISCVCVGVCVCVRYIGQ